MVPGFSHLTVKGYRRLRDVDLELRPLNVLIGANGVGKSSVLDVLDLMAASAGANLESSITELGGMASLLTADGQTTDMVLSLQMAQDGAAPLDYEIKLSSKGYGYEISYEKLMQQRTVKSSTPFKYIDSIGSRIRYQHSPDAAGTFAGTNTRNKR